VLPIRRKSARATTDDRDAGFGLDAKSADYSSGVITLLIVAAALLAAILILRSNELAPDYPVSLSSYLDTTGTLRFSDICCGDAKPDLNAATGSTFKSGGQDEVLWLKVSPPSAPGYIVIHSPLDHIVLVRHDGLGNVTGESVAGDMEPVAKREIRSSFFAFVVNDADLDEPVYLRVRNHQSYGASLNFVPMTEFESYRVRTELLHLIAIAIVLFMMAYNVLLSALIRDAAFLLNAMFAGGLLIVNLAVTGFGNAFLWAGYEIWSNEILIHAAAVNVIIFCLFAYVFLTDTPLRRPYARYFGAIIAMTIVGLLIRHLGFTQLSRFALLATLLAALTLISLVCILGTLRGDPRARVLLIAEGTVLLPGNILFLLQYTVGRDLIIPPQHIIDLVLVLEALFFSLALAYRLRIAQTEADEALELATRTRKEASARILEGIDTDRRRIASDLHDTAGQGLLVVSNQLTSLSKDRRMSTKARSELSEIAGYSKHIIGDIRRISHDLHPSIIEHLGWENAVKSLFTTMQGANGITCDVRIDKDCLNLDSKRQLQVYRILQEATNNIARHSKATNCEVRIHRRGNVLRVRVSDNGVGFFADKYLDGGASSLGLEVMRQRAECMGGSFRLTSTPRKAAAGDGASSGTDLEIVLPFEVDAAGGKSG
jgi:signal transduction histidine kinase